MAKKTIFINPQYTKRFVCWVGHCERMRYRQRRERARILKALANETIAATEKILHGYWLVAPEAEASRMSHIVQDIRCADRLYHKRICVEHLGRGKEFT